MGATSAVLTTSQNGCHLRSGTVVNYVGVVKSVTILKFVSAILAWLTELTVSKRLTLLVISEWPTLLAIFNMAKSAVLAELNVSDVRTANSVAMF